MDPLTLSLISAGGTAIGALPDIIPSKYERDQKKRLKEMQRKQEMGALGLTEQQRSAIEGQMRGARQQAQQYADAERARLTQPTAQPQMALLGQQMQDESRQRLEADLASQILNLDLQRKAEQEQEIKDLQAAQAQYKRARAEGLTAPFQSGAEAYVGQMGMERLLEKQAQQELANASQQAIAEQAGKAVAQQIQALPAQQQQQFYTQNLGLDEQQASMLTVQDPFDVSVFSEGAQALQDYHSSSPSMTSNFNMAQETNDPMQTKRQTDKPMNYIDYDYLMRIR